MRFPLQRNKSVSVGAILVSLVLLVFVACQTSNPNTISISYINGTRVCARGEPNPGGHTVFQFNKGEPVKILEKIAGPDPHSGDLKWLRVQVPADVGLWVHGAYLSAPKNLSKNAHVTANLLHVRSGGGKNFPILDKLAKGSTVRLTGAKVGDWVEIMAPANASVYVAEPYVGQRIKADRFNVANIIHDQINLENMIHREAGWPDGELTQLAYDKLTWLSFRRKNVADLSVLTEFDLSKLANLDLTGTKVTNLTPLTRLTSLKILILEYTKISDLSPLKALRKLEGLYLTGTPNLTMAEIEKLQQELPNCKIYRYITEHDAYQFPGLVPGTIDAGIRKDLKEINGLNFSPEPGGLKLVVRVYNTQAGRSPEGWKEITSLESMAKWKNVEHLELNENRINDLTPLAGFSELRSLHLGHNQISNLTPLTGLKGLKHLSLGQNSINDLTPLSRLTELEELNLCDYKITDLKPLANLKNLKSLGLGENQITNLTPLTGLMELEWLSFGANPTTDLAPLAGLTSL